MILQVTHAATLCRMWLYVQPATNTTRSLSDMTTQPIYPITIDPYPTPEEWEEVEDE